VIPGANQNSTQIAIELPPANAPTMTPPAMAMTTPWSYPTAMAATVTPPATIANLFGYPGLLTFERMNTGGQHRRICTWTDGDIGDCDHAKKRNQREHYFHRFLS
jgi:hypothetical protein